MASLRRSTFPCLVVATVLTLSLPGAARAECPVPCTFEELVSLGWDDLERIYRCAQAGPIPQGYLRGRAIYCPEQSLARARSLISRTVWRGKHFDSCTGSLVNQWRGFRAVRAQVCLGPSWLDGQPSIVMDYLGTSKVVWADVRDELREVAPGLYVGLMYRRKSGCAGYKLIFVLEAACKGE